MPTLHNPNPQDLYSPVTGELVPAGSSVEITDEQAELVNTTSGVWVITAPKRSEVDDRSAQRRGARRGSVVAEVSGAPRMETRGGLQ